MNILFVGKRSLQESLGVEKKLDNQMAAFRNLGHAVWYTVASPETGLCLYGPEKGSPAVHLGDYRQYFPATMNEARNNAQMLLDAAACEGVHFDLCYIRKPLCDAMHLKALAALRQRGTAVVEEIPTYPYDGELARQNNLASRVFLAIDRHYRKKLHKHLNFIATYSMDKEIFGVPAIQVENAVRVDDIPLSKTPPNEGPLHIITVSSMYFWHGYDRLIQGLGNYYKNTPNARDMVVHMVGDGPERPAWEALARELGLGERVVFHGAKSGAALEEVYNTCHIGVSSLGWYRKGMGDTPTFEIKTRDYISRGKPLLFACVDPRAIDVAPYSLQCPNNATPIDIARVPVFYDAIRDEDYAGALRAYAEKNLRWEAQMQKVVEACTAAHP